MVRKMMKYERSADFAQQMDSEDPLARFRNEFQFPVSPNGSGKPAIYLCGNSLGLQPKKTRLYINEELDDWAKLGVEGHFHARHPWLPYHENLTASTARHVGAQPAEVVTMNSLTVNVHLLMVSFYRPTQKRYKILTEAGAFPSDQYAVASQARIHGFEPSKTILELKPRAGEWTLRTEDILETIERHGNEIALIWLGNVNYLTGQCFDMKAITEAGHKKGCLVGFDLAHGAGNLLLKLHDWSVDCAAWCSYKYLNAGPGGIAGVYIHERWVKDRDLPRFAGWWGHNKDTRFKMGPEFDPIPTAESWQLSNPPIFQLAALRASMEIFDDATMEAIRRKGDLLTGYLEFLLDGMPNQMFEIITPRDPKSRGCQLSLKVRSRGRELLKKLNDAGVIADFREPDIVRVAPAPLYNSFMDVFEFGKIMENHAKQSQ
jgi:kynureninase